jgi:hypothetical protein
MADILQWSTLVEAAEWLEGETGNRWTDRAVLSALARLTPKGEPVQVVFPAGDASLRGELQGFDAQKPTEVTTFFLGPATLMTVLNRHVESFLTRGVCQVGAAGLHGYGPRYGVTFFPPVEITMADLSVAEQTLRDLLDEPAAMIAAASVKPGPLMPWQEDEILKAISKLGLNPHEIVVARGKRGPKAEIKTLLRERDGQANWSESKFNKAWERLIASNSIRVRVIT